MSDTVQLVPSLPVVARPPSVRPDQHVEPAKPPQAGHRSADNGSTSDPQQNQSSHHLTISRQGALGTFVYRSIDDESGKVVWQYPSESILRASQHLKELEARNAERHLDEKA